MHNVWSRSNGLTLSERGFPPYAAPNVGMVQILRLVKTQCSCSSAFSSELWPWIGSSLKYDCSLVIRGSVRFHIQSFLKITTWTRSSALIGPKGTLLVFLFQAPFTKIDMHRSGSRPAPTGTDEMHTTQGQTSTTPMPGTCVQYPGRQGGSALGDALIPSTLAGSMAPSVRGGTYSHVAVVGGAWGGEKGAASATAAAAARWRRATPAGGAVTPPRSAPAHGGRGGRHGARAGGWDRPPRDGAPLIAPLDGVSNRRRAAATEADAQARSPARHRGRVEPRNSRRAVVARRWGGHGGRRRPGPVTPVAGQSISAT